MANLDSKSQELDTACSQQVQTISLEDKQDDNEHVELGAILCLADFEQTAKKLLDPRVFNYFDMGADEQVTRRLNHQMIVDKYFLRPRCFRDVSKIDTTKYIFGDKLCMPIGIAPIESHKLVNKRGELATVRAASNQNALMILSQLSSTSLEEVAKEAPICTKWQNIYLIKDREHTLNVIHRAIRYGYRALVVTCNSPVDGYRRLRWKPENNNHHDQTPTTASNYPVYLDPKENSKYSDSSKTIELDDSKSWQDLADLKRTLGDTIRIIVKGILSPDDADSAVKAGVDGIYVSNSGGTQLDCCQTTIEALPEILRVVNKRVPVFVDGGFQTGTDVLKALALGADMVFMGRPIIYSLASKGEQGVEQALKLIHQELKRAMAFCGCNTLDDITGDIILERK